jgi:hypothetical protein
MIAHQRIKEKIIYFFGIEIFFLVDKYFALKIKFIFWLSYKDNEFSNSGISTIHFVQMEKQTIYQLDWFPIHLILDRRLDSSVKRIKDWYSNKGLLIETVSSMITVIFFSLNFFSLYLFDFVVNRRRREKNENWRNSFELIKSIPSKIVQLLIILIRYFGWSIFFSVSNK